LFSTRGRANTLRLAMAGRLGESGLGDEGVYEVLDLCLECRACKAECPIGVDVARFKSEFLAGYWQRHGMPLKTRVIGHAMARPVPGFLGSESRRRLASASGPILYANSDLSGFSIFEEAQYRGVTAADRALIAVGRG